MFRILRRLYVSELKRPLQLIAFFAFVANLMILSVPLHMMQVYGRILSSRSLETLIYITGITLLALVVYGVCEMIRMVVAQRLSLRFLSLVSEPLLRTALAEPEGQGGKSKTVRNIQLLQSYLSSKAFTSLFDVPFVPIFVLLMFLLHPVLGLLSIGGAALLAGISVLNHFAVKDAQKEAGSKQSYASNFLNFSLQRDDEVLAMGLADPIFKRWGRMAVAANNAADRATYGNATFFGISRAVRLGFQVSIMAVGAWLVIGGALHAAMIFAASLIAGKVLAPVEQLIGGWKNTLEAINALEDVNTKLQNAAEQTDKINLPDPVGELQVENISYRPDPKNMPDRFTLRDVSFNVSPGEAVAILGPSGSGKSTLARILAGVVKPSDGVVRLDGFTLDQWNDTQRGASFGFMPQDVWLFPGTVAENIARMSDEIDERAVVEASHKAGVHDLIGQLPKGYNTLVGPGGLMLSGGQRQRIALARAFYGRPKILILDEPNAHLDTKGTTALSQAIAVGKADGMSIVIISQRRSIIEVVDRIVLLVDGKIQSIQRRKQNSEAAQSVDGTQAPSAAETPPGPQPHVASLQRRASLLRHGATSDGDDQAPAAPAGPPSQFRRRTA